MNGVTKAQLDAISAGAQEYGAVTELCGLITHPGIRAAHEALAAQAGRKRLLTHLGVTEDACIGGRVQGLSGDVEWPGGQRVTLFGWYAVVAP
jgi:hypothetical protein